MTSTPNTLNEYNVAELPARELLEKPRSLANQPCRG